MSYRYVGGELEIFAAAEIGLGMAFNPRFSTNYLPKHAQNRMASEGNLVRARMDFDSKKMNNLQFLLRKRYEWMNEFIRNDDIVIEIGAGAGLSKCFIDHKNLIATDVSPYPWIDLCIDALDLPFGAKTIDVIICVNVIHHLATPIKFLLDAHRCLKNGGYLLLLETNPSLLMLLALRIMRHEGWSFDCAVFDPASCANDPADPWSGNNAISHLLFGDKRLFERNLPGYEIARDVFSECMLFPLSGGVTAKTRTVELPNSVLSIVDRIDSFLCRVAPTMFAMARSVALRKKAR
ncbi:MAG: class I SAM-dependent methyltransferase [Alphaproteobacteria bacterium]|nr:class I SAM-dependent methyltransferase [Alphaproteobacteria bacterium]